MKILVITIIVHIAYRAEWDAAQAAGEYRAASLASQGFIHCSTASQLIPVANAFYRGQHDLVLLLIDPNRLKAELRWEPPDPPQGDKSGAEVEENGGLFPHLYGPLNLDAVVRILDFPSGADGSFLMSDALML